MLQEFALWAEVLGGIAVIGGIIFGIVQLRLFRRQRADQAAVEVMRSMLSEHFPSAYRLLNQLPDGVSVAEVQERGSEYENAIFAIGTVFETLGYMVFKRVIPLMVVRELVGGVAIAMWRKAGPYAVEISEGQGQPRLLEWYEWLVKQLEDLEGKISTKRAIVRFADWKS
ncbi:MAG: hypothetical protein ABFS14_02230 [Gemmatimonadota bacterium]